MAVDGLPAGPYAIHALHGRLSQLEQAARASDAVKVVTLIYTGTWASSGCPGGDNLGHAQ
jgi:hypothetical protein